MAIDENTPMKTMIFAESLHCRSLAVLVCLSIGTGAAHAEAQAQTGTSGSPATPAAQPAAGIATPPGYVIGPDDALAVVFWREKELSADVVVRPDGMISLPLLNDVKAEGLTPEQLRLSLTKVAAKFVEEPTVTVVVKAINSCKVFITGQVGKPGPYPLGGPMSVLQLIAMSGGVAEYAKKDKVVIVRKTSGKDVIHPFNYEEVMQGKKLQQNIELMPGDTVIVP